MVNKDAEHKLAAALAWLSGMNNAIGFLDVLKTPEEAAKALEAGARCVRRAAELMEEAAKSIREDGKSCVSHAQKGD